MAVELADGEVVKNHLADSRLGFGPGAQHLSADDDELPLARPSVVRVRGGGGQRW
ncbi:hypothetical protein [Frankia sp. AgB32]|uniref:hypothetical protein n=1 Tax=Frankia sp. AgB32 TaxID=631119 RepID=UPI00200F246E|nr:hypothetical protein [Frankia sp. AgB32]MCK9896512.1 hypothetical protein [Frankia sp. AgB32]